MPSQSLSGNVIALALIPLTVLVGCGNDTDYAVIGRQGALKAISIPAARATDLDHYQRIVTKECQASGICILSFFSDLPSASYPLSDSALAMQTAQFNRNTTTGLDRLLLACRLGDFRPEDCF